MVASKSDASRISVSSLGVDQLSFDINGLKSNVQANWLGRHVIWQKKPRGGMKKVAVKTLEILELLAAIFLPIVGWISLTKGLEISKRLDNYKKFEMTMAHAKPPNIDRVVSKTETATFNHVNEYVLNEGKIWFKPKNSGAAEWKLMYFDGFSTNRIPVKISSDGANLVVLDDKNEYHYRKVLQEKRDSCGKYIYTDLSSKDNWFDCWFSLPVVGPVFNIFTGKRLKKPDNCVRWAISHRGIYNDAFYDEKGFAHPVVIGVTSLYMLTKKGKIYFADPWLPFGFHQNSKKPFDHEVPLPENFVVQNFDVSASTLFLLGKEGRQVKLYTSLRDFDTLGRDPVLELWSNESYKRRGIKPDPWKSHELPPLHGLARITKNITISQNGKYNDARELTVIGTNQDGRAGYYFKPSLKAAEWTFIETPNVILAEEDFII